MDKIISLIFDRIEKLDDTKFKKYVNVLKSRVGAPINNLIQKSSAAWNEIYEETLDFGFRESLIQELENLTPSDLQEFYTRNFLGQPKKLSIRLFSEHIYKKSVNFNKKDENYGFLNNKLKSYIYTTTDFLHEAKTIHK